MRAGRALEDGGVVAEQCEQWGQYAGQSQFRQAIVHRVVINGDLSGSASAHHAAPEIADVRKMFVHETVALLRDYAQVGGTCSGVVSHGKRAHPVRRQDFSQVTLELLEFEADFPNRLVGASGQFELSRRLYGDGLSGTRHAQKVAFVVVGSVWVFIGQLLENPLDALLVVVRNGLHLVRNHDVLELHTQPARGSCRFDAGFEIVDDRLHVAFAHGLHLAHGWPSYSLRTARVSGG